MSTGREARPETKTNPSVPPEPPGPEGGVGVFMPAAPPSSSVSPAAVCH